jgi:hypothetical protein
MHQRAAEIRIKVNRVLIGSVGVLLYLGIAANPLTATEGGGTSKALGVDTVITGVMPPPGLNFTNFLVFYTADQVLDSSGNERPGISDFDLFVVAETLRFRYVWPKLTVLGANIETRVGFNVVTDADVSFDVQTPFGSIHLEDSTTNVGDSLFGLILGWHGKRLHQMFGPEFFLPTGRFSSNRLVNVGRGYYAIGPSYWFTWFPIDEIEVSGALIYLINFENGETNYGSGNEISFDYNLAYTIMNDWQVGISGYAYKQVADDELNGVVVGDGNRGQVVAFGPAFRWHPHNKPYGITLKWQHEELVENRASGDRIFLQGAYQF